MLMLKLEMATKLSPWGYTLGLYLVSMQNPQSALSCPLS